MLSSSKFVVALHILAVLAHRKGPSPVCSKLIAQSVGTNPVVIRRLMAALEQADLVVSTAGRHGGFALARPPARISLADVYRAVEDSQLFKPHASPPNSACPVGARIQAAIATPLQAAENGLLSALAGSTLDDIAAGVAA
jgi:Rrf2 family protein